MKAKLKKIVRSYTKGIPFNILFVNFLFQKILRIDSQCKYSKSYTSRVIAPHKLYIENDSEIVVKSLAVSGGCYIQAAEGIHIGEGTIWSFNVSLISQGHDLDDFTKIPKVESIRIGKRCWIGANSTVLPGVQLGDKTIVGANSVVTKSFPEGNVVIAGTPAKLIRRL